MRKRKLQFDGTARQSDLTGVNYAMILVLIEIVIIVAIPTFSVSIPDGIKVTAGALLICQLLVLGLVRHHS